MQRSRRLVFILSPDFLSEKSFSLLECRLGLYLQHNQRASIAAVVYRSVNKLPCAEAAQLRQAAAATVTWRGSRSEPRRSRFWLRLRLALPVRPLALGRRMIDSTSSHSDLAALALQKVQQHNQRANQSRGGRRAPPRGGRGRVRRGGVAGSHGTSCSGCAWVIGQVQDRGSGPTVEMQQMSHDRTEPPPQPDCHSFPDPVPTLGSAQDTTLPTCQQMIGARTSESPGKGEGLVVKATLIS
ncbi:hypothetical protein PBY51_009195 [Eleginops maclovinus]|uniref:TIR domain-containing protein n=1 Tax=Eleginops maclovinus TaxID=56733 RepID=A0AAN7XQJ1_ELEMC|nr:hypothetical protein PBY51_009195 [Eleginops maclovinus]